MINQLHGHACPPTPPASGARANSSVLQFKVRPDIMCATRQSEVRGSLMICSHNGHAIVRMTLTLYLRREVTLCHAMLWACPLIY